MTTSFSKIVIFVAMASAASIGASLASIAAAQARPPTAQFSPGYEARLAEARKAAQLAAEHQAVVPLIKKRRSHHRAD